MPPGNPTRWRVATRLTFAAAGAQDVYVPLSGGILNVLQLMVSSDAAAELVPYLGAGIADRLDVTKAVVGLFLAANGGASPDLSCMGAWSPTRGASLRLYASTACNVWIEASGIVEAP